MTYNSTLTKVFVYLLTSIEAIYQTSVPLEIQNRKNVHLATSDCLVITCYLWGVLHFSETLKAKQYADAIRAMNERWLHSKRSWLYKLVNYLMKKQWQKKHSNR